jgi:hypothetical protein
VPTDAYYLRVRFGFEDDTAIAATAIVHHVLIEERLAVAGPVGDDVMSGNDPAYDAGGYLAYYQIVMVTADGASRTIQGIDSTGMRPGRILWLMNISAANNVVLAHESASASDVSYRIRGPNAADVTIRPHGGVMLMWGGIGDGTTRRWRVLSEV